MKQSSSSLIRLGISVKQWLWKERRVLLTATGVTGGVMLLRLLGLLQSLELTALDQLFRLRPLEPRDDRIVIIGIDDADIHRIQAWPIPDGVMADVLEKVRAYNPRAIGLDIYRDLSVGEGRDQLQQVFSTTPNLIGIEKIEDAESVGVRPPAILSDRDQVGFNNVVVDSDSRVRRALLFWTADGQPRWSFALRLATIYLESEGISPKQSAINPNYMQLGQAVFRPLQPNDGGYVRTDAGGYQILANVRGPANSFLRVSLTDLLENRVPPGLLRDRIVLIGSTAASLKDFFYTSYSSGSDGNVQPISGVELHANFISQILSAATQGRSSIRVLNAPTELLWILAWSLVGASLSWQIRSPGRAALALLAAGGGLLGICYGVFLGGWWIPLVPPLLTLAGSAIGITTYIAYLEEELKKSKEFLNSVINTIPDPIFVKDQNHRWIVLNDAYCRFIGHPLEKLLDRSDEDFFPPAEAKTFWRQDEIIFTTGIEKENEEEFTNSSGETYLIATKRSLHKDAAGNLFLVGVIRDITQRKQMEEELKRTAAELVRSNAELRQAENRLRKMAYHDTLTGLPNRDLFQERLSQAVDWAEINSQLVALLFLDLDGFKGINDGYGHHMGNLLLKAVAQRLLRSLRGTDTVARLGGDEFVVILPAIPGDQDACRVAEKILSTLSQHFVLEGTILSVTTSIGISIYPTHAQDPEQLVKQADIAMYAAKGLGKNRYALAEGESRKDRLQEG